MRYCSVIADQDMSCAWPVLDVTSMTAHAHHWLAASDKQVNSGRHPVNQRLGAGSSTDQCVEG